MKSKELKIMDSDKIGQRLKNKRTGFAYYRSLINSLEIPPGLTIEVHLLEEGKENYGTNIFKPLWKPHEGVIDYNKMRLISFDYATDFFVCIIIYYSVDTQKMHVKLVNGTNPSQIKNLHSIGVPKTDIDLFMAKRDEFAQKIALTDIKDVPVVNDGNAMRCATLDVRTMTAKKFRKTVNTMIKDLSEATDIALGITEPVKS